MELLGNGNKFVYFYVRSIYWEYVSYIERMVGKERRGSKFFLCGGNVLK